MLIESYGLEITFSDHSAEHFEFEAIARLPVDISAALPYFNPTLPRAVYFNDDAVLSWRHEGSKIGFWADRIAPDRGNSDPPYFTTVGNRWSRPRP